MAKATKPSKDIETTLERIDAKFQKIRLGKADFDEACQAYAERMYWHELNDLIETKSDAMPHELLEKAQNLRTEIEGALSGTESFLERLDPLMGLVIDLKGQLCRLEQKIKINNPEPIKSDSDLTELLSNDLGLLTRFAQLWSSDYFCPWSYIDLHWNSRVMQLKATLVSLRNTIERIPDSIYDRRRREIDAIEKLSVKIKKKGGSRLAPLAL